MKRFRVALVLGTLCAGAVAAQVDSAARCDSVLGAARVDSVRSGVFVTVGRFDDLGFLPGQAEVIANAVGSALMPPNPLRLTTFSGTAQMRSLRRVIGDTAAELRAPTLTGVYRFTSTKTAPIAHLETVRASLVPGFDSAAVAAIRAASVIPEVVELPTGRDSMRLEIRLSTDSIAGARRILTVALPRMRVVNAVAWRDNLPPVFPGDVKDSTGEVVLRFVVDREGVPDLSTVELSRGRSAPFIRSALMVLGTQRFNPATVNGCPVSQVVYYPFAFVAPDSEKSPPRH